MSEALTAASVALLLAHAGNPGCTMAARTIRELLAAVEAEAVETERKRIADAIRIDLRAHPAHVDAYGLGRVLKGEPWPEG